MEPEAGAISDPAYEEDDTYFWPDNVLFLVERRKFRVPRFPFIEGSEYFAESYKLRQISRELSDLVNLRDVTVAQFKVFLRILLPMHKNSTTISFSKLEWVDILTLSTEWHFHDLRKLAIEHLDGQLSEVELVQFGRTAFVPRWVVAGYIGLVLSPGLIKDEDGDTLGSRALAALWVIAHKVSNMAVSMVAEEGQADRAADRDVRTKFASEIAELEAQQYEHRTTEEVERDLREVEATRRRAAEEEEAKRLEEERLVAMLAELKRSEEERAAADQLQRERIAEPDSEVQALRKEIQERERRLEEAEKEIAALEEDMRSCTSTNNKRTTSIRCRSIRDCRREEAARLKLEEQERLREEEEELARQAEEARLAREVEEAEKRVEAERTLRRVMEEQERLRKEQEEIRKREEEQRMRQELEELRAWKAEHEYLQQAVLEEVETPSRDEQEFAVVDVRSDGEAAD